MISTSARSIPGWLAGAVQELELNGNRLLSLDDIRRLTLGQPAPPMRVVQELKRRGWLRALPVKGQYEFIPGAAAGPYPSGDPWLSLRAALRKWPGIAHVGANSAAWLRGYAQRSPSRHIIVARSGTRVPLSLLTEYQLHQMDPAPAGDTIDGLPVPTPAELFAEIARLAPRLDLDSAQGWLRRLLQDVALDDVGRVLANRGVSTRARAGYIADVCGAQAHADAVRAIGNLTAGPYYTGPRHTHGRWSPRWRVYDTGRIA